MTLRAAALELLEALEGAGYVTERVSVAVAKLVRALDADTEAKNAARYVWMRSRNKPLQGEALDQAIDKAIAMENRNRRALTEGRMDV